MDHDLLAGHIETIETRTSSEMRQLIWTLQLQCWPTRGPDRSEPAATESLALWDSNALDDPEPGCRCDSGRCGLCN